MEAQVTEKSTNIKAKKIGKIVINVCIWLFVAFAVVMTVIALAAQSHAGVPQIGGKCYLNVLSGSMEPTIKTGDMVVCRVLSDEEKLTLKAGDKDSATPGDVISFWADLDTDGKLEINTHRIVEVKKDGDGNVISYVTLGDNNKGLKDPAVNVTNVIGVWTGKRVGLIGGFVAFLQKPTGFLIFIVLPLVVLFFYQAFVFIKTLVTVKNSGKRQITAADEELIKQRAIEEYLRSQQQATEQTKAQAEVSSSDEAPSDN